MKHPERIRLWVAARKARKEGAWRLAAELEQELQREKLGQRGQQERLDQLQARLERLDARRREAPGQMGLDFGSTQGAGPGGGEPCGQSWIDPNKECHKNGGGEVQGTEQPAKSRPKPKSKAVAPIDTTAPFSSEVMEKIVAGIEQRSFAPSAARHNGTDLALALQKLAEAPGLTGEHAREAMAFMDEVGAVVMITPIGDYAPTLDVSEEPPARWDPEKTPEQNKAELNAYFLTRTNAAERGRNFAKRTGLWPDELIDSLKADRSPHGEALAGMISRARDGVNPDGSTPANVQRFSRLRQELDSAIARHAAAPAGIEREQAQQNLRNAFDELRISTLSGGPDYQLNTVRGAIEKVLGAKGTKGHYQPGGNIYWKVSMAGVNGSRLHPDEIKPSGMQPLLANNINVQDKTKVFSFSATLGLSQSEQALTTHLHELGHMIHDASARTVRDQFGTPGKEIAFRASAMNSAPPDIRKIQKDGRGPTRYSNTTVSELFAESFVGYVAAPTALKANNPELYDWVQRTTKRARRNAVASREATNWYLE
jgi:hypothetical protein